MPEIVDGTAEEIGTDLEVVHAQPPAALFGTTEPTEIVESATKVANALADVIRSKGLSQRIQGKDHVLVEGWQLLGVMLGVTAVCVETVPVDGGYKATVEARAADGRVVGRADALCTKHEKRGPWKNADDYARLSMAQTRATSKALKGPLGFVVSLAGYSATPAEEMTFAEPEAEARALTHADVLKAAGDLGYTPLQVDHVIGAEETLAPARTLSDVPADQLGRAVEVLRDPAALAWAKQQVAA